MFKIERNRSWNATQHSLDATFRRVEARSRAGKGHGTTGRDELHDSCDVWNILHQRFQSTN